MLLALPSFANMGAVFQKTKEHLSEILSAFEYFDRQSYDLVCQYVLLHCMHQHLEHLIIQRVIDVVGSHTGQKALADEEIGDAEAFVLIETSGGKREHDESVRSHLSLH